MGLLLPHARRVNFNQGYHLVRSLPFSWSFRRLWLSTSRCLHISIPWRSTGRDPEPERCAHIGLWLWITNRGTLTPQGLEKSNCRWLYQTLSFPELLLRFCLARRMTVALSVVFSGTQRRKIRNIWTRKRVWSDWLSLSLRLSLWRPSRRRQVFRTIQLILTSGAEAWAAASAISVTWTLADRRQRSWWPVESVTSWAIL